MQAIVIGAGIGGLTAALTLLRSGLEVRVFEQASELREVGAGIQVSPNAARLLHRLGLEEQLRQVAVCPVAIEMRRWQDGTVLSRQPLGAASAFLKTSTKFWFVLPMARLARPTSLLERMASIRLFAQSCSVQTLLVSLGILPIAGWSPPNGWKI